MARTNTRDEAVGSRGRKLNADNKKMSMQATRGERIEKKKKKKKEKEREKGRRKGKIELGGGKKKKRKIYKTKRVNSKIKME